MIVQRLGDRAAPWLTALATAVLLTWNVLVEWSFPYCSDPEDGPLYALFGAPLPFLTFSGASSMRYTFAPHLYALDVVMVTALLAPLSLATFRRLPGRATRVLGGVAALTLVGAACWAAVLVHVDFLNPELDVVRPPWVTWSELRPVGVAFDVHYDCTPLSAP